MPPNETLEKKEPSKKSRLKKVRSKKVSPDIPSAELTQPDSTPISTPDPLDPALVVLDSMGKDMVSLRSTISVEIRALGQRLKEGLQGVDHRLAEEVKGMSHRLLGLQEQLDRLQAEQERQGCQLEDINHRLTAQETRTGFVEAFAGQLREGAVITFPHGVETVPTGSAAAESRRLWGFQKIHR